MNDSTTARPWSGNLLRLNICWLACVAVAFISTTTAAQDDVVIFKNGDRLTGEIRGLSRGQLSFNTDATGTIEAEWGEVAELTATETFEIELASGVRYLGSLPAAEEPGELNIDVGGTQPLAISFTRIVAMTEIEANRQHRNTVNLDTYFRILRRAQTIWTFLTTWLH